MRIFILLFLIFCWQSAQAADTLVNITPKQPQLAPGMTIYLPGGEPAIIEKALPDGSLQVTPDIILSQDGTIIEGQYKGQSIIVPSPGFSEELAEPTRPEEALPQSPEPKQASIEAPAKVVKPRIEKPQSSPADPEIKIAEPAIDNTVPANKPKIGSQSGQSPSITIAELLPMTKVPQENVKEVPPTLKEPEKKEPVKETKQAAPEPIKEAKPKKAEPKKEAKNSPVQEKKPEKKKEPIPRHDKVKNGEALRIPPEAAKTGNLSFLEGCWQGTRPEYYSKRTIRECFCFGANGKNGKRRVIDPLGHRKCIGASSAKLSSAGVLSVTSSGAVCDDGERWGQAEMICRNTGPNTPCSWLFRDAQNAQQSYQIPFIRVESCGR